MLTAAPSARVRPARDRGPTYLGAHRHAPEFSGRGAPGRADDNGFGGSVAREHQAARYAGAALVD
jgi:hypothetical protein